MMNENKKLQDLEKIFKAGGDAVCIPSTKPQTLTEFLDENEDLAFRLGAVEQSFYCDDRDKFGQTDCEQQCMTCCRDEQALQ